MGKEAAMVAPPFMGHVHDGTSLLWGLGVFHEHSWLWHSTLLPLRAVSATDNRSPLPQSVL